MITSIELYLNDYKETCFPLKTACHLPPKILSRQQVMKHASTSHSIRCSVRKNRCFLHGLLVSDNMKNSW